MPRQAQPAEVDRFFGRRVDCSCQTDDLPLALPHVSPPEPVGAIAPPAILKRTRLLAPPQAKVPGRPLAVSIVCSSRASSSDEEDDRDNQGSLVQTPVKKSPQPSEQQEFPQVMPQSAAGQHQLVQQFVLTADHPHQAPQEAVVLPASELPQLIAQPQQLLAPVSKGVLREQSLQQPVTQLFTLQKLLGPQPEEQVVPLHLTEQRADSAQPWDSSAEKTQSKPEIIQEITQAGKGQETLLISEQEIVQARDEQEIVQSENKEQILEIAEQEVIHAGNKGEIVQTHDQEIIQEGSKEISQHLDQEIVQKISEETSQGVVPTAESSVQALSGALAAGEEFQKAPSGDIDKEQGLQFHPIDTAEKPNAAKQPVGVQHQAYNVAQMPDKDSPASLVQDHGNVTVACGPDHNVLHSLPVGEIMKSPENLQQKSHCQGAPVCNSVDSSETLPEAPTAEAESYLQEHHQVPTKVEQEPQSCCEELGDLHTCSISQELPFNQNVVLEPEGHEDQPVSQGSSDLQGPESSPEQVVPQQAACALEGTRDETHTVCENEQSVVEHECLLEAGTFNQNEGSSSLVEQSSVNSEQLLKHVGSCVALSSAAAEVERSLQQSTQDGNTFIVSSQPHPMHVLVPSLDAAIDASQGQQQRAPHSEESSGATESQLRPLHQVYSLPSTHEGVPSHKTSSTPHEEQDARSFSSMPSGSKLPADSLSPAAKRIKLSDGDTAEPVSMALPCSRNDSDSFMDDCDSASSCEALHIVESVPEEEVRSVDMTGSGESQDNVAGHFLVVSGGRRVAASLCSQIPVQLVVSHGVQQLKRLACNVTCRRLEHRRQFTFELKLGSSLRPLLKPWSRTVGRPAVKRQRPKRFQLRFKPTTLPQQLRLPVIGLQREEHPSEQVLEEQVPLSSSEPAGPHLDKPKEEAGHTLNEKPTEHSSLEGSPEESPRRRGRPRNIGGSPGAVSSTMTKWRVSVRVTMVKQMPKGPLGQSDA
ncbi:hypothetical protein HPB51_020373 [Rhipicephalus microplus]|uniref:Uncharacterized protein n=1 Tax=Rhipicephalus microplus TaxID=6941 RepID=A0A9J6DW44_RHIMP|nr:hypothetical protein HPB51_020373 [Rhipicephalus microplus]